MVTAACCGFGAAILWVAQGRYISRIATDENKGTYFSIFWAFFMSSLIIGTLFGTFVLKHTNSFNFYCLMTLVNFMAALFFLFLRPIHPTQVDPTPQLKVTNQVYKSSFKQDIVDTMKLLGNRRMMTLFPSMALTALNIGVYAASLIKMMVDSMEDGENGDESSK